EDLWEGSGRHQEELRQPISEVRDLPGADRRQVLVSDLHARRRHAALQERVATYPHGSEVSGLQTLRGPVHDQVRRHRGGTKDHRPFLAAQEAIDGWMVCGAGDSPAPKLTGC